MLVAVSNENFPKYFSDQQCQQTSQFPSFSHHDIEIDIVINRSADAGVVVYELVIRHDTVRVSGCVEIFKKF